tara:strand:- start:7207 stop:7710 length:504 start_codon:yes stop_codon:yes gene_type:complete
MELIIPIYTALMAAWAGGSLWPSHYLKGVWTNLPEVLFALPFAYVLYPLIGWYSLLVLPWVYIWMQTGHANALPWGDGGHNTGRTNTLSPVVRRICGFLAIPLYTKPFCRVFMGVKGFLISLPIGGIGCIGWALGYDLGHKMGKHVYSELLSGAFMGASIALFMVVT